MMICEVCGSENFEKHAGFMYCGVCQTQSQDYYEQEYEYQDHEMNTIRHKSRSSSSKAKKQNYYDDGSWTSWEGFNYILYGMLEELKNCGVNEEFKDIAFKLWAAYLKECQVAFTSKFQEKIPKLRFRFKERDARVLYNTDVSLNLSRKRKHRSRSCASGISTLSESQLSKRSLISQRRKIITGDYQDHLSTQSTSNLADETLESLGRSSDMETADEFSDDNESLVNNFKHMFNKKEFNLYKNSLGFKAESKVKAVNDVRFPGKNRLLSIIHLALLMTGSQIQLSDLMRFIRESHLSFAKVTHFFPNNMKFPRKDISYIEVISDSLMPTHLHQRLLSGRLARLLRIEKIPTPNTSLLIDRYCQDLNLPEQVAEYSKKIIQRKIPSAVTATRKPFPGFEAWAMSSLIFVMKLLFGLNDKTEIFLSHLAREINSTRNGNLFVFKDWQNFIECRKTVLTNFHYPTQEQLENNCLKSSKSFLDVLMKESKDEYRHDRFIPYSRYYIDKNLKEGIKQTLSKLVQPQSPVTPLEFKPSLTPQTSHLETILEFQSLSGRNNGGIKEGVDQQQSTAPLPEKILKQSFRKRDIKFTLDPKSCLNSLEENSEFFAKFDVDSYFPENKPYQNGDPDFLFDCSSRYWMFHYPNSKSSNLCNFNEEILEKTPENFQWLLRECARMLEMNVRDVYTELLHLEKKLTTWGNKEPVEGRQGGSRNKPKTERVAE